MKVAGLNHVCISYDIFFDDESLVINQINLVLPSCKAGVMAEHSNQIRSHPATRNEIPPY